LFIGTGCAVAVAFLDCDAEFIEIGEQKICQSRFMAFVGGIVLLLVWSTCCGLCLFCAKSFQTALQVEAWGAPVPTLPPMEVEQFEGQAGQTYAHQPLVFARPPYKMTPRRPPPLPLSLAFSRSLAPNSRPCINLCISTACHAQKRSSNCCCVSRRQHDLCQLERDAAAGTAWVGSRPPPFNSRNPAMPRAIHMEAEGRSLRRLASCL
jgi:hypothetical protein